MSVSIGLLGAGSIGTALVEAITDGRLTVSLGSVYDRNPEKVEDLIGLIPDNDAVRTPADASGLADGVDLVVEAAGQGAVREVAQPTLTAGCDLLVLSVGAFADRSLFDTVLACAEDHGTRVYVPSGAIAGLDAVKAAAMGGLESVTLTTTKPPAGLDGAPYLETADLDLGSVETETTVFEGPAREAASAFPSNINVAMALSLAGVGADDTTVRIVADPASEANVHEIHARGVAGTIETRVENAPSPDNPKTSYLAPLSTIARLAGMTGPLAVGT